MVFISYRRADSNDVTGRIYDRFCTTLGPEQVFKGVDNIPLGVYFRKHVSGSLDRCSACIVVIGKDWLNARNSKGARRIDSPADHVRLEIETALNRDIPEIPVLVQGAIMPHERELPGSLATLAYRNGLSVRPDPDCRIDMDRLVTAIQAK